MNTNKQPAAASRVISIRVPMALAQQWDAHCQQQGKSPAKMYKALMQYIVTEKITPEKAESLLKQKGIYRQVDEPDARPKERLEIRFTVQELAAIRHAAETEGSSPQQFIVCAVRAALTNEPQYTLEPAKALWAATTELRAIGRNINQIARRLNEADFGASQELTIERLNQLEIQIKSFTAQVSRLQTASIGRWKVMHE